MVGWHHQLNGHEFEQAPGDGEGQESQVCCSPWGLKESDTTEQLNNNNKEGRQPRGGREAPCLSLSVYNHGSRKLPLPTTSGPWRIPHTCASTEGWTGKQRGNGACDPRPPDAKPAAPQNPVVAPEEVTHTTPASWPR